MATRESTSEGGVSLTSGSTAVGRHWVTAAAVALLAIPVLPLEFGLGKISLGTLAVAVIVLLAIIHTRHSHQQLDHVETAIVVLAAWVALRLLVVAPLIGEPVWSGLAVRDVGVLVGAVGAYRLGQVPATRGAVRLGLYAAFALLVGVEAYQELFGLKWLISLGYTTDQGFFYYTEAGTFRPFGLFTGPTTFATFLAMVGMFLAFTTRNRWMAMALWVTTLVCVAVTETRAALFGLALVAALAILMSSRIRQSAVLWVFTPFIVILLVVMRPDLFTSAWQRLMAATDVTDTSRTSRIALWQGAIEATGSSGRTLIGMGDADWIKTMGPQIGRAVFSFGHAHSNFFQSWYRYGVIGAILFTVLLAIALGASSRAVRLGRPMALGSLAACLIFTADSVFNNSLSSSNFVLMLFLLLGMSAQSAVGDSEPLDTVKPQLKRFVRASPGLGRLTS